MNSYIYLLQDGNDKNSSIYKIGRTTQHGNDTRTLRRFRDYSQGTIVYNIFSVPNHQVSRLETHIKTYFNKKYILVRGTEWFQGNLYDMKKDIDMIIDDYHDELDDDTNESDSDTENDVSMDIKKATEMFTNAEHQRHFTRQIDALGVPTSTKLVDFFNNITQDPLRWLSSLPKEAQSDDALRKYKTPLNFLLNNTQQVIALLGEQQCDNIRKNIQKGYKKYIDQVLKQRNKTMNIPSKMKDDRNVDNESESDSDSDNDSDYDDTVLNVDELEYENPKDKIKTSDYKDKIIKTLEKKLQDALTDNKVLKTSVHHLQHEIEFLREVVRNVTAK
jgi:T5orf172 domain